MEMRAQTLGSCSLSPKQAACIWVTFTSQPLALAAPRSCHAGLGSPQGGGGAGSDCPR